MSGRSPSSGGPGASTAATLSVRVACAVLLALVSAGAAPAQTPVTAVGLGYPVAPVDARAAVLGGTGMALPGGSLSGRSPAALTEFDRLTLGFTLAPEGVELDVSEAAPTQQVGRSRFSGARVVVPFGEWRVGLGFSPELDQDWRVTLEDTLAVGDERFPFRERRVSDGGLSSANFSLARRVGPLSVGVAADRLTGSLDRSFRRTFRRDSLAGGRATGLGDVRAGGTWSYRGWRARGGLGLTAGPVRLGAAAGVSGELTAEPLGPAETRTYDYPASLSAAGTVRPTDGVLLTAGGGWTGWSSMDGDLRRGRAEDTYRAGGGIEFPDVRLGPLSTPLRLGANLRELPFAREGRDQMTERSVAAGLSIVGSGGQAAVGLSVEFGTRGEVPETGVAEDFQRLHLTLQIRQ